MVALDTNVVVRLLVGDEPVQTKKAERVFLQHADGDGVYLSLVVIAEVGWVLDAAYSWDRPLIHDRITRLARTRGVIVEELELVLDALDDFAAGKACLADYLILGKSRAAGRELLTFAKSLVAKLERRCSKLAIYPAPELAHLEVEALALDEFPASPA